MTPEEVKKMAYNTIGIVGAILVTLIRKDQPTDTVIGLAKKIANFIEKGE